MDRRGAGRAASPPLSSAGLGGIRTRLAGALARDTRAAAGAGPPGGAMGRGRRCGLDGHGAARAPGPGLDPEPCGGSPGGSRSGGCSTGTSGWPRAATACRVRGSRPPTPSRCARFWLVPALPQTAARGERALPVLIALGGATDWLDGALRRAATAAHDSDAISDTTADLVFFSAAATVTYPHRAPRPGRCRRGAARHGADLVISLAASTRAGAASRDPGPPVRRGPPRDRDSERPPRAPAGRHGDPRRRLLVPPRARTGPGSVHGVIHVPGGADP